jgi:hypothetical protein
MLVASFILIWLLSKLYGVLKMLRMERQIKDK